MTDNQDSSDSHRLILRQTTLDDYDDIAVIMEKVYPGSLDGAWNRAQFESQIQRFPEGQICIEDNGKVVAAAISMVVKYTRWGHDHRYWDIVGNGYLTTHDPKGDVLYGVDVFVHPEYRDLRLGRRLYDARKELCEQMNLRGIVVGGRIPGYHKVADQMTPQEYVAKVRSREITDPILTFQLANDFQVRKIVRGYLPDDKPSAGFAVLLEWVNIYHEEKRAGLIGGRPSDVRIGAVQWQMRPTRSLEDLYGQIEYFVDAVSGYQADVVLFPEFFNGPLMAPGMIRAQPRRFGNWPAIPRPSATRCSSSQFPTTSISWLAPCPSTMVISCAMSAICFGVTGPGIASTRPMSPRTR